MHRDIKFISVYDRVNSVALPLTLSQGWILTSVLWAVKVHRVRSQEPQIQKKKWNADYLREGKTYGCQNNLPHLCYGPHIFSVVSFSALGDTVHFYNIFFPLKTHTAMINIISLKNISEFYFSIKDFCLGGYH